MNELLNELRELVGSDKNFTPIFSKIREKINLKIEEFTPKEILEYTYLLRSRNTCNNNKKAAIQNIILSFDAKLSALEDEKANDSYKISIYIPTSAALWQDSKLIDFYEFKQQDGENQKQLLERIRDIFRNLETFVDSENTVTGLDLKKVSKFLEDKKTIESQKKLEKSIQNKSIIVERKYNNKLDGLVTDILTEYEKNSKNVFDDFNDLYTFVQKRISKNQTEERHHSECLEHKEFQYLMSTDKPSKRFLKKKRNVFPPVIASPSLSGYESALIPMPANFNVSNAKEAHLRILTPETLDGMRSGSTDLKISSTRDFSPSRDFRTDVGNRDYNLLNAIYAFIYYELYMKDTKTNSFGDIVFYEQDLAQYIGRNIRGDRRGSLIQELVTQFDDLIGVFKDGSYYKLFTLKYFNIETGEIHAYIGYLDALKKILSEKRLTFSKPKTEKSNGKYKKPQQQLTHTQLVHTQIYSRIKTNYAIEIVIYITTKIQQAGSKINTGRTYKKISIKPQTIIDEFPQLKESLDNAGLTKSPTQSKNDILKRVFSSVYIGLEKYTDLSQYYIDFSFSKIIPTVTMLEKPITFQHKGQNRSYELPKKH